MARPKKIGLEYFPVDVTFDEKVNAIEMIHGNNGLSWVIKFWQNAYQTETGEVNLQGLFAELHANKCRITIDEHEKILNTAIQVEFCYITDSGLYTSNGIKKRIGAVSKERASAILRQEKDKNKSIVKDSKVKKTPHYSANNTRKKEFLPPTLEEVKQYCKENGYENISERAFKYYSEANPPWTDSRGKPVLSWKSKFQSTWFRGENSDVRTQINNRVPRNSNAKCTEGATAKPGEFDEGILTLEGVRTF